MDNGRRSGRVAYWVGLASCTWP